MTTKVILYFPSDATDKAVTYDLVKRYDLRINILRAESRRDVRARCSSN